MSHKKLTKQQLQENYRNLFEIADELSGSNFYKRWDMKSPEEEKADLITKSKKLITESVEVVK